MKPPTARTKNDTNVYKNQNKQRALESSQLQEMMCKTLEGVKKNFLPKYHPGSCLSAKGCCYQDTIHCNKLKEDSLMNAVGAWTQ